MREFLRFVQRCGQAPIDPRVLDARIGAGRLAALRALGVMIDRSPPTVLPCGGMGDCQREVVCTRDGGAIAVCGADEPECESQRLSSEALARVSVSMEGLARLLAALAGLDPLAVQRIDPSTAWALGRANGRTLLFTPAPFSRSFELLLLAQSMPTVVYAPCRDRVPVALEQRYRSGERVELRFLEDELTLHEGRVRRQMASVAIAPGPTRTVIDRRGERGINEDEYTALLASDMELVLDLTATADGGGHPAYTRVAGRKRRAASLPARHALALVELVRAAGRPLRAPELRCMREAQVRDPERVIEIARKTVDVPLGRYAWRCFHTVRGATPEAKAYAFRPPPDMTYAVVVPAA